MINRDFKIKERSVGGGARPYIIAEIGSNFDQSLDLARRLIDECAAAGVDAVKFQLFRAGGMYPEGSELYDIFKSIELSPDWLVPLKEHADGCGVHFLASPFDQLSVDRLVDIGVPAMKLASSETTKLGFVQYVASKNMPVLMSTGMCDLVDVIEGVNACKRVGNDDIGVLQCGARYPLPVEQSNLQAIDMMRELFGCPVGFSDHTEGLVAAIAATARHAAIIEKHVTLDRSSAGPDHFFALETKDLGEFVRSICDAHAALGNGEKEMLAEEKEVGRREGLHASRDLKKGETISESDFVKSRPAIGMRSRYAETVVGAIAKNDIEKNQPIFWDAIIPSVE